MRKNHSFKQILLTIALVLLGYSANAQCGSEGSFTIDQSALNLPRNSSSSYTSNTCSTPVLITGSGTVSDPGAGDVIIYDSYIDGVFMVQYGSGTPTSTLTYTFSEPITITNLRIDDIDQASSYNDDVTVSATGANVNVVSNDPTVSIITGDGTPSVQVRATSGNANSNGEAVFSTDGPITQLVITYTDINTTSGQRYINVYDIAACCPVPCTAGTTAPAMETATNFNASTNTYTIPCGESTADLSALTASNDPASTTLTVHSATPVSNANKLDGSTTPPSNAVPTGTYYIAFYDATNDCYSPATAITVDQETDCCNAGTVAPTVQ